MLAVLVGSLKGFELVGQAGTIEEASTAARELRPDIVMLDWIFPGGGGAVLTDALNAVASGGVYFGPAVARTVDALVRTPRRQP
jgi:DNA-binding NarL/FixJ family response regulator